MKKLLFVIMLVLPIVCSAKRFIKPQSLNPGDTIAVISPASMPDSIFVAEGCRVLSEWGYVPIVGKYALTGNGTFSGTIEERLADMKWAFETPSIKAVMCSRGGYGSVQELSRVTPGFFAKHPKWLVGYSDISAVHSAMAADGVMSIHGHMCQYLMEHNGTDSLSGFLKQILTTGKIEYNIDTAHIYNKCGVAKGRLFGGNLSVLNDISGSRIDFMGKEDNLILFLEDVSENLHSISRIFYRLKICGVLNRVKGLIIGSFTDYKPDADYANMNDMIHDIVDCYNIPIVFDFPSGHQDMNFPLIQGADAILVVSESGTTLTLE